MAPPFKLRSSQQPWLNFESTYHSIFLSFFILSLSLSLSIHRCEASPSEDRIKMVTKALANYTSFQSLYPTKQVILYIANLNNATFLLPNDWAVQQVVNTTSPADIIAMRDNWLLYLTIPYRQTVDDFRRFLTNLVIYPYPTAFGMPLFGEVIFSGVFFVGDTQMLNFNAFLNRPNLINDPFLVLHGVDNAIQPPKFALKKKLPAYPPPFRNGLCGAIQPDYIYKKNLAHSKRNLYKITSKLLLNVFRCARNCTLTPACVGFVVYKKTCYFKSKMIEAENLAGVDTYIKCKTSSPPPPPPRLPPPRRIPPPQSLRPKSLPSKTSSKQSTNLFPEDLEAPVIIKWFEGVSIEEGSKIVEIGTTVSWKWDIGSRHSIKDLDLDENIFQGLGGGNNPVDGPFVYNFTFNKLGVFSYECGVYSLQMRGIINVVPKDYESLPCRKPLPGFTRQRNIDRPGNNFLVFSSKKRANCAESCRVHDHDCAGFVFYGEKCYLKSKLEYANTLSGAETYSKCL